MSNTVSSVGNAVTSAVNTISRNVTDVANAVIKNPLPIIETLAVTSVLGPAGAGLTSTQAAAVGAAAVTAANGGDVKQIATSAASAGVGSEVTQLVAPSVTPVEGAATGSTSPVASAAGGAAGGATQAALTGQNILKGAATGGAVSGGAALGAQGVSAATSPGAMSNTGANEPTSNLPATNSLDNPSQPISGNQALKPPPGITNLDQLAAYGNQQYTGGYTSPTTGENIPLNTGIEYKLSPNVITPGGVDYGFTQDTPTDTLTSAPQTAPGLTKAQQDALQSVFGFGIGTALAPKSTGLGGLGVATTGGGTTGTTSSTTGGAPGGTELDPSTGKAPEKVWGEKYSSLKEGLNV